MSRNKQDSWWPKQCHELSEHRLTDVLAQLVNHAGVRVHDERSLFIRMNT
jgi:hypothetical protein